MRAGGPSRAAIAALLALAAASAASADAAAARWGADWFTNLPLTTQDGKVVRLWDDLLAGKVVAIDLVYTHCKYVCPLETARLAQVQRLLGDRVGKDVFFYSITVDPKRDTPEVLKAYAEKFHAGPGWLFLTGSPDDVKLAARKLGLYFEPAPEGRDGHTAALMVGDVAAGQWMKQSAVDDPRFVATAITNLLDRYGSGRAARSYAAAAPLAIRGAGEYLFTTRCSACHTIGLGDRVGPDLRGVAARRSRAWLARYLAEPDRVLAEGDPVAKDLYARYKQVNMPNLRLGPDDVSALLAYLGAPSAGEGAATDALRARP